MRVQRAHYGRLPRTTELNPGGALRRAGWPCCTAVWRSGARS